MKRNLKYLRLKNIFTTIHRQNKLSIIRRKYINLYISICLLLFTLSKISVKGRKPGITLVLVRTNDLTSKVKAIIKVRKSAITVEEMDRKDEIKLNFQEL